MSTPTSPARRLINHVEFVYRAGERKLAARVFELLGFRVMDDGKSEFMAACADPLAPDMVDNVCYASQVTAQQWAFEEQLQKAFASGDPLARAHAGYHALLTREPQRAMHWGMHTSTLEDLEATVERVRQVKSLAPELEGRISVSGTYYPGDPGSLAPNIVQAFFYTDVIASGLLSIGQHIEIHWYTDRPPALSSAGERLSYTA
jgi:hypothetical protein